MLVPLFLGALCHTFSPEAGKYFGSFTNGMITGTVPILAVWFFCMGASIKLSATGTVLRKSGTLVVTKIAVAWVVAAIASRIIPEHGVEVGFFAGLSTLALVAAMDMTNGGLYASIMQQYGTKEEAGAFVLMSLESGPLMTMIILGTAGIASFEPHVFVGAVLPFLVGFALGNLDPELREFFSKAVQTLIPFFAFALGNTIDLTVIAQTGLLGILLGVAVIIVTGIPLIIADKLIGGGDGRVVYFLDYQIIAFAARRTLASETKYFPLITTSGCDGRDARHLHVFRRAVCFLHVYSPGVYEPGGIRRGWLNAGAVEFWYRQLYWYVAFVVHS